MASPSEENGPQGLHAPESGVSELVTVLGNIIADERQTASSRQSFPSRLFDALLRCDVITDSQHLNRLLSTLDQNRDRIRGILHRDSLWLLAYVLLNSDNAIEQESGLYLILDGPTQADQAPLSFSNHVPPILYSLTTVLFCIFLDKAQVTQCRRMAGKLIIGLLNESSEEGPRILQPKDLADCCPRIVSIVCHEKDVALKFLAGTIIRILRTTGTDENQLWKSREPKYRSIFFECLQEYPNDWMRAFHHYTSEMEHYELRKTRASSRDGRSGTIQQNSCHLLNSIEIGPRAYSSPSILALSTPAFVLFILPCSDYIEIPVQHISEPVHRVPKRKGGDDTPCLEFEATGGILLNGRQQPSEARISIVSDQDLGELRDILIDARKKAQKQSRATRRISSTIVALDTADEVATKSSQCRDSSSQASNQGMDFPVEKHHNSRGEPKASTPDTKKDELRAILDVTREPSGPEESSLMTIEDVEILAEALSESDETHLVSSNQEHRHIDPGKKIPSPCDVRCSPGEYVMSPIADDYSTLSPKPAENITESDTANIVSKNSQSKNSGVSNRRATQKKPPYRRSPRSCTLGNRKGRPALPNTQESLLFPRMGRPNKKIYTSRSKRVVDWEEDLRPTEDEEEAARAVRNDSQLTSVPSPPPGDTSIFSRGPNKAQKKRKARVVPSSAKGKRSAKKRGAGLDRRGRTPRLPLQTKETNVDNGGEGTSTAHEAKTTDDLNGSTKTGVTVNTRHHDHWDKENTSGLAAKPDNGSAANVNQLPPRVQGKRGSSVDTVVKWNAQEDATKGAEQGREGASEGNPHMGLNEQPPTNKMAISQKTPQRIKPIANQEICVSPAHDEQALMERPAPEQKIELPNEYGTQQSQSDQPQGSGDFHALFISQDNEIGRLFVSMRDRTHDTPVETGGNGDDLQTEPEERLSVCSRKRAATQSTTDKAPNKKSQLTFAAASNHQKLHQLEDAVERDGASRQVDIENSSDASMGERSISPVPHPEYKSALEKMEGNLSEQSTTPEGGNRIALPTSSHKKSIVDENGSPRLTSRQIGNDQYFQMKRVRRLRLEQWRDSLEEATSRSGYHGDSDDDSLSTSGSASTHLSPKSVPGSFKGGRLNFRPSTILVDDVNEARPTSRSYLSDDSTREKATKTSYQPIQSMITPYSVSELPTHRAERADTRISSATTIRLPQEPTQLGIQVEEGPGKANWQASLDAIQKTTHDLLLHTNQRLTHQLEHEKGTIGQVLDSYQQSCHQVMDQLFQAHEERIELYKQQMQSVRKQHSDLCQDLIRRLGENDRRIQERLLSGV